MGAAEKGKELGTPSMDELQQMLWDMVGGVGEPTRESEVLRALIESPLKDHEAGLAWVIEESTRVGIMRKEYDTVVEAVALGVRLAFKFEPYLRARGTVFLDVDISDVGRGQGYREFEPLPGTAPLEIEEEFIALGESFRKMRGAYGISSAFILALKEQFLNGEYRPDTKLALLTSTADLNLPQPPVASWLLCPRCDGDVKSVDGAAECLTCRLIWCDPRRKPSLDESAKLMGTEARLPDVGERMHLDLIACYTRGPGLRDAPFPD